MLKFFSQWSRVLKIPNRSPSLERYTARIVPKK